GLTLRKFARSEIDKRVKNAARILDIEALLERKPKALSGGQRQRVAMGRAIVRDPKVFLFDEPLSNLDAKLRVQMRIEIKALHQRLKTTTVYVTHDQIEAMTMADRIVVMHDGVIEQIGTPLALFDRPANLFVAQFIGSPAMNVFEGVARGGAVEALGQRWPLPPGVQPAEGAPLHYGVRPGDLVLAPEGVEARVVVVEPTGAETELLLEVAGTRLVAVMHGRTTARPDDLVRLHVEPAAVHAFDGVTGQRLG
ncbi:MAG: ABC transporter ATP-binding protein, partial [Rubrivivax sp.]